MKTLQINAGRLEKSLQDLGRIGETPQGMQRTAFSSAEIEARGFVSSLMQDAGLEVRVDAAGNLIGRRRGEDDKLKPILMGSHIDTVPCGGKYDGALGVMGGIEVCQTLADQKMTTRHLLEVIAFTNEEGAFLNRGLLGSRAMAGLLEKEDFSATDEKGKTYADWLPSVGGNGAELDKAVRRRGDVAAYFELHVEQGPNLIRDGIPIGVVTGITGRAVYHVPVRGFWNHAGTTPMDARQDALVAASRFVLAVEQVASREDLCRVGTVGIVDCRPGAINVIPGEVDLEMEFRDLDMSRLEDADQRIRKLAGEIASQSGVKIDLERIELEQPTPTLPAHRELIEEVSRNLGFQTVQIESGAGHDAQAIAHFTDIGMIFVPSVNGISHSPEEFTSPEDCANGTNVLLGVLLEADQRID